MLLSSIESDMELDSEASEAPTSSRSIALETGLDSKLSDKL